MKSIFKNITASFIGLICLFSVSAFAQLERLNTVSLSNPIITSSQIKIDDVRQEPSFNAVGNADVEAVLLVNGQKLSLKGRSSFHMNATPEELEAGQIDLGALNIVFSAVNQEALTYGKINPDSMGNLSFAIEGAQRVKYDARSGRIAGEISGVVGANYMAQYATPIKDSEHGDHVKAPRQKARLSFELQLSKPISLKESDETQFDRATMNVDVQADFDQTINAYEFEMRARPVYEFEYVITWYFEIAKRLCVQPVRFSRYIWSYPYNLSIDYTGAGLGFGQPGADSQWRKADVLFTWRNWKTVYDPSLFFFSTSEAYDVLDTVDDDDCVEVFFVEGDAGMHNGWGGGASFYGGEAYTKIISSDGNVDAGVDFTHLAHELGHSMDLPHPGWSGTVSSTGTLMCPSGFANDNPPINSQQNKDNISNPLFTFALKTISAGPDCTNSGDCGPCPSIP